MDIISGLVALTGTFFVGTAVVAAFSNHQGGDTRNYPPLALTRSALGTLVVVYFAATTVLLVIAQQYTLAGGNAILGLVLVLVQYAEPSMRAAKRPAEVAEDGETWRR